jgi:hypothetical protein
MALQPFVGPWTLFQFIDPMQPVGHLGRGISPSLGLYLHIEHKHRINAHTDIHALSGIRTQDPKVLALDRAATVIGQLTVYISKSIAHL